MWKPEHRQAANRSGLRYPSDLTDAEWAIVAPMIPPARHGGRKRSVNVREVLNGIFYILWISCQWKALPKDLPPKSTVHDYLELWNWDGTLERFDNTKPISRAIEGWVTAKGREYGEVRVQAISQVVDDILFVDGHSPASVTSTRLALAPDSPPSVEKAALLSHRNEAWPPDWREALTRRGKRGTRIL